MKSLLSLRYGALAALLMSFTFAWSTGALADDTFSRASSFLVGSCSAEMCINCSSCEYANETTCDQLCSIYNGPEGPGYPACDGWLWSQSGPTFCDLDNCSDPTKCIIRCNCATDEHR